MNTITQEEREARIARSKEVAGIIREQIGHKALYMIGAKDFICGYAGNPKRHYIEFRIMRNAAGNCIQVYLDEATDTYRLAVIKIRGLEAKIVADESGIYCDQLADRIGKITGLAVRL